MRMKKLVKQFLKFGIVGVSNTLIAYGIYYGLLYLGVHYIIAYTIGFAVSVLNAYFWSSRYVFDRTNTEDRRNTVIKTYLSYGFTFLLSNGLLYLLVEWIHISDKIAPVLVLGFTIPANFLLNRFWVFNSTTSG